MSAIRRVMTAVLCFVFLVGCQEDGVAGSESEAAVPDILAVERTACERRGGRWALAVGKTSFTCYRQMSDANQPCAVSSDCDGMCLARSRTCSPIEPFFGCHEVLSSNGTRQTLCIE